MKNFIFIFLYCVSVIAADVKISQLPLGTGSGIGVNDSFPYVQASNSITKRLTIYDLVNVPLFVATYAPKANPTFTGVVTAPSFVGPLTGNASTATALAANPTDCSSGQYANAIAANGNLTCSAVSTSQLSGTLPISSGGTGQTSFSAGYIKSTGSALTSSSTVDSSDISGVIAIANGGTNNGSLAVTAGGVIYTDGSKLDNVGAGTSGYFLKSNGSSAPSWVAGMTNPLTTTGDIIYSSSGSTPTRLAIGSTGNRLVVSSGVPAWGGQYQSGDYVTYSAIFNCSSSSSITTNYGLISSIGNRGGTGCTITINSGLFTAAPACTLVRTGAQAMPGIDLTSATSINVYAANSGNTFVDFGGAVICHGIKP